MARIHLRMFVLFLGDWVLLYASLWLALFLRQGYVTPDFWLFHVLPFTSAYALWICVFYALGLYEFQRMRDVVDLIEDVLLALAVNLATATALFYALPLYVGMAPKTHLLLAAVIGHAALLAWRQLWVRFFSVKYLVQRIAFLGDSPFIQGMSQDLKQNPRFGFERVWLGPHFPLTLDRQDDPHWILGAQEKRRLGEVVDVLVASSEEVKKQSFWSAISLATSGDIELLTDTDFYEQFYKKIPPLYAARPTWLLRHVLSRHNQMYLWLKRLLDIALAAAALAVVGPVIGLLAAVGLLEGTRPFYRQKRIGRVGKEFWIWKLRTMAPGADRGGPRWKSSAQDVRVTRWGAFLRRFRLDELPQLWNVLKGDMSLVGPRPEWEEEDRVLEREIPHYYLRHLVRPGITGWAQINFRATNSVEDSVEKLHYDLYYVKNISLALDISILLKTVKRVFTSDARFSRSSPAQLTR